MKVLCVHASAGAGHMKAAEAIYNGLKKYTDCQASFVDALDYAAPASKSIYRQTYFILISKFPALWALFFSLLDVPFLQPFIRAIRRLNNFLNFHKLQEFLIKENFDYVISTHFMPIEVVSSLKRKGKISSKLVAVVTDYDVHRIWLAPAVDKYCVASDWTKGKLKNMGIDLGKVFATGIPTDEKFSQSYNISELKEKLGLHKDAFTVLMATGSFGIGPIEKIIQALTGYQVVVICGHNADLYKRLKEQKYAMVKPFPLVDNMHEMMAVSDVMVTKPGGLSISEALVSQLPMIFFNAIPGQEAGNVRVLGSFGIGKATTKTQEIVEELSRLRSSKDTYMTALKLTKALAHPSAVKDIISLIK